ncbi:MAG: valine--tRNA ligase [Chloroflexi bacterium]|nr:valine--tRNA ligase [Chloroflexota bacterium]
MTQRISLSEIPRAYEPQSVEKRIYDFWTDGGYFTPETDHDREPFTVIMPPPNVTGELHMGHALTIALEDLMVRWHRMKGESTLYLPGSDHAGIATQVVVERMLAGEGVSRHDLGRDGFNQSVWQWVDRYGSRIYEQTKRIGASCDWTRAAFTLDEGPSAAVRTTFVNLYKKGLIYRGERITNWCPRCHTALSDLEVKYREENGNLYQIRYDLEDGSGALIVATTRPETLLGDTAVAVNPEDERYTGYIGKCVILPVLGRKLPVIGDEAVELGFGTGALKVTPGHDLTDFEIGQRNGLPTISVMNLDGTLNSNAGPYEGQSMEEARKNIVAQLEEEGLLEMVEPYKHSVGHCDRCDIIVEPIVTKQWYVRMEPLAKPARDAVANGETRIIPDRFAKVYFNWMDNIRDWCISRQLWWGHRVPVWYCDDCDEPIVELEDPASCTHCPNGNLRQDEDVLDTWFSSALWTHSTLGWPRDTDDLDYFYPTSVMETGYDIIFFWVARMMMMGIENMGKPPFHTVYLHGLVLDPEGVKMSKTKGNVLDPLQLIDMYGADALRFALTIGNSPGNDQRLNEQKLESSRNFANKLWNAARFVMSNLEDAGSALNGWYSPALPSHRQDRWIMSRLNRVAAQVDRLMHDYQFGEAQRTIHDFFWHEYADWYIEMAKIRLRSDDDADDSPLPYLAYVLDRTLRMLHPFMPFVTEEIWQSLKERVPPDPDAPDALIVAEYPMVDAAYFDDDAEEDISLVMETVRSIRNLRAEFRIQQHRRIEAVLDLPQDGDVAVAEADAIKMLARVEPLKFGAAANGAASADSANGESVSLVLSKGVVTIPLGGLVDLDKERERIRGEIADMERNRDRLNARLGDERFLSRAPGEVVERERERLAGIEERKSRAEDVLARLDV